MMIQDKQRKEDIIGTILTIVLLGALALVNFVVTHI